MVWNCDICQLKFDTQNKYRAHVDTSKHKFRVEHGGTVGNGYRCELCEVVLSTRKKFDIHCLTRKHINLDNSNKIDKFERLETKLNTTILKLNECDLEIRSQKAEIQRLQRRLAEIQTSDPNDDDDEIYGIGFEDYSYLKKRDVLNFMKYPKTFLKKIMKLIHFNDRYPKNQNIRLPNLKNNDYKIYNGDSWESVPKRDFLEYYVLTAIESYNEIFGEEFLQRAILSRKKYWTMKVDQLLDSCHSNYDTRMNFEMNELEKLIRDETDRLKKKRKNETLERKRRIREQIEIDLDRERTNIVIQKAQEILGISAIYVVNDDEVDEVVEVVEESDEGIAPLREISVKLFGI